jgi:hypothetical protein
MAGGGADITGSNTIGHGRPTGASFFQVSDAEVARREMARVGLALFTHVICCRASCLGVSSVQSAGPARGATEAWKGREAPRHTRGRARAHARRGKSEGQTAAIAPSLLSRQAALIVLLTKHQLMKPSMIYARVTHLTPWSECVRSLPAGAGDGAGGCERGPHQGRGVYRFANPVETHSLEAAWFHNPCMVSQPLKPNK